MVMNESNENYLETILVLNHRLGNVRSVDIANEMNFKKPSVSVAMKNLRENGYITVSPSFLLSYSIKERYFSRSFSAKASLLTS